jgi:hypothetical protein
MVFILGEVMGGIKSSSWIWFSNLQILIVVLE